MNQEQLVHAQSNEMVHLPEANVAWVDFAALRRDFPELREQTEPQIEKWVIDNYAFISREQMGLDNIRFSDIKTDENKSITSFRPPDYQRADVLPNPTGEGFINIKGTGHNNPTKVDSYRQEYLLNHIEGQKGKIEQLRVRDHSDGLMSLGEAIAEVTRQNAAQKLFDLHNQAKGTNLQTVESYFIIHVPGKILKEKDGIPLALYGRQAHWGRSASLDVPKNIYTDPHGYKQQSTTGSAVDFGGVLIKGERLIENFKVMDIEDPTNPQNSQAWIKGHELAERYIKSPSSKQLISAHLQEMTAPIEEEWSQTSTAKQRALFNRPNRQTSQSHIPLEDAPKLIAKKIAGTQEIEGYELLNKNSKAKDIEKLIHSSAPYEYKSRILSHLQGRDDEETFDLLLKVSTHKGDPFLQEEATTLLKDLDATQYPQVLKKYLTDTSPMVRRMTLLRMKDTVHPNFLDLVELALKDINPSVVKFAMAQIKDYDYNDSLPLLRKMRENHSSSEVQKMANELLKPDKLKELEIISLIKTYSQINDENEKDKLLKKLIAKSSGNPKLNYQLLNEINKNPSSLAFDYVKEILQRSTDPNIQLMGIEYLKNVNRPQIFFLYEKLMKSKNYLIATKARESFLNHPLMKSPNYIKKGMANRSLEVRVMTVQAMAQNMKPLPLELLESAFLDDHEDVKIEVIKALQKENSPQTLFLLAKALNDPSETVRKEAALVAQEHDYVLIDELIGSLRQVFLGCFDESMDKSLSR
jgi:HEAT repeat protein